MTQSNDRFTDPMVITIIKPSEVDIPEFQAGYKAGLIGDTATKGKGMVWIAGWQSGIDEYIADLRKIINENAL